MNVMRQAIFGISLGVSASLMIPTAQARTKCDGPRSRVDQKACAAAAEGPDALRRFVDRTKAIYGLYFWDYLQEGDRVKPQANSSDVQSPISRFGSLRAAAPPRS